jgi:hypothetical protein
MGSSLARRLMPAVLAEGVLPPTRVAMPLPVQSLPSARLVRALISLLLALLSPWLLLGRSAERRGRHGQQGDCLPGSDGPHILRSSEAQRAMAGAFPILTSPPRVNTTREAAASFIVEWRNASPRKARQLPGFHGIAYGYVPPGPGSLIVALECTPWAVPAGRPFSWHLAARSRSRILAANSAYLT